MPPSGMVRYSIMLQRGAGFRGAPGSAARTQVLGALLVVAVLALYWPAAGYDFVSYDDPTDVVANPLIAAGLTADGVVRAFAAPYGGFWIPVTWVSYMIDVDLFGIDPGGFHVTNVLIHAANGVLVFLVLRTMTGALWRSLLAAALFALHPLRVESVAWIAQRKDVLSAFFFLLSLLAYAFSVRRPGRRLWNAAVPLALLAGMMAKPVLIGAPFLLLLLDYWPLGRVAAPPAGGRRALVEPAAAKALLLEKLPVFIVAGVFAIVALAVHGDAIAPMEAFPALRRLEIASTAYLSYLRRMVWPSGLALVTVDFRPMVDIRQLVGAAVALAALTGAATIFLRRLPFVAVGWLWYVVALLPVSGLIPSGVWSTADRFSYLPHVGICVLVAWLLAVISEGRPRGRIAVVSASIGAVVALGAVSSAQLGHWRDTYSLFSRTLAVQPDEFMGHLRIGEVLLKRGDLAEAETHLRRSLAAAPLNPFAHATLGMVLWRRGKVPDAAVHFEKAADLNPADAEARFNLGTALAALGRTEEAVVRYRQALLDKPDDLAIRVNLGIALFDLGRLAEARVEFERGIEIDPGFPGTYDYLGRISEAGGDVARAREFFGKAAQLGAGGGRREDGP